ncbi:MAG: VWA domain-containing protein [Oscillospiraceae bacterium]|nr:VWA domain-containing protein [Oscillospiraceae bacterium]
MKKRALCWLLVLVMVASLLPASALAILRPVEEYVSAGTNWQNTTDYQAAANQGNDKTLYYKDGDNYYPVTWNSNQQLYTISGTNSTNWTPRAVASGTYFYNVNSDKVTFSQVSTKWGYVYYPSEVEFKDLTSDDMSLHEDYWYWVTEYYVKANDVTVDGGYSHLMLVNYGTVLPTSYFAWAYYFTDGRFNSLAGQKSHIDNHSRGVTERNVPKDSYSDYYKSNSVKHTTIGGDTKYQYTWAASNKHIGLDTYLRTYAPNSLWYNNGGTQLGSTVYDTDGANDASNQTAWTGALYVANGTGTTVLTANGNTISTANSAINGDTIYSGDLYILKTNYLPQPSEAPTIVTTQTGEDGTYTDKTLTANGDAYDVTLYAYTTGNEYVTDTQTTTPVVDPMDIVMVIDQSGSMATQDMGDVYSPAATPSGGWTVEAATGGKQYYFSPDGGSNYYPVYASSGYVYEKTQAAVTASDMLGDGDDAISLGVNGAPTYYNIKTDYFVMDNGELHRLYLITAGLFLQYGLYPYIYKDNGDAFTTKARWEGNNYWVAVFDPWDGSDLRDNGTWNMLAGNNGNGSSARFSFVNTNGQAIGGSDSNADSARLSYSWFNSSAKISNLYKLSDTKVANALYYVDAMGNKQQFSTTAQYADDVVYTGTLYEGSGTSRVEALKTAVTQFTETVQQNAETFGVDHRMAFVGFAGNKIPAYSMGSDATTVGSNGLADYTNTGLYESSGFENYEKITGYEATTDQYINRHYYQLVSGSYVPVRYINGTWYRIDLTTGARTATSYSSSNWYKAIYEGKGTSLSAADYQSALMSVNDSGSVNSQITSTIGQFAANGGTYTSYGMTMAEQLFNAVPENDRKAANSEGETVDRQRVIIVFTDGEPGGSGYEESIAGEALVSGNLAKTEQDALVYTVGLFKGTPSAQVSDFMQKLSSEYVMNITPIYGGPDNSNYSLGSLNPNKTYYYKNETTGKYYAVTTEYGDGNSLGWWIYNGSANGTTTSYTLTTPRRSTGAGTTVFYNAKGSSVNGEDVVTGTTYYTSDGDKIVYEYRWFDSDRSIKNPFINEAGHSTDAGETRVQFYELSGAVANTDEVSYYMTASNATDLNSVFAQIAGTIVKEEVTVTNGSDYNEDTMYVMDEISADFDLPAGITNTPDGNHVTVYADKPTAWATDENGKRYPTAFETSTTPLREGTRAQIEAYEADVSVSWEGKKLSVDYFDFGRKYMQETNGDAARIRVVIDGITPNKPGTLYSNTAQSGLYYTDRDEDGNKLTSTLVEAFPRPTAVIPGYTVTWVDDTGSNMETPYDQDTNLIKGRVPAYDGSEPTKESVTTEESVTTYKFDGWSTTQGGALAIPATRDAETDVVTSYGTFPAVVNSDVTYYAHFASETSYFYTATWYNGETKLYTQEKLSNGDVPTYGGAVPTKNADDDYTYFFAGWHAGSRYNATDSLPYQASYSAEDLANYGVLTQLPAINGADVTYYAVFAPVKIPTRNIVLDFGAKALIQPDTVTGYDAMYTPGGDFSLEKADGASMGSFYFTPKSNRNSQYNPTSDLFNLTGFAEVNTGIYYEDGAQTKVNIIPAGSVYFDEDIKDTVVDVSGLDGSAVGNDSAIQANTSIENSAKGQYTIKFKGTGIDVYCTTYNMASGG